jgi:hypothetical protein
MIRLSRSLIVQTIPEGETEGKIELGDLVIVLNGVVISSKKQFKTMLKEMNKSDEQQTVGCQEVRGRCLADLIHRQTNDQINADHRSELLALDPPGDRDTFRIRVPNRVSPRLPRLLVGTQHQVLCEQGKHKPLYV